MPTSRVALKRITWSDIRSVNSIKHSSRSACSVRLFSPGVEYACIIQGSLSKVYVSILSITCLSNSDTHLSIRRM